MEAIQSERKGGDGGEDKASLVRNEETGFEDEPRPANAFSIHVFDTADKDTPRWLWSCLCPICASFLQRIEFLGDKFPKEYYCFQNSLPFCKEWAVCRTVSEISNSLPWVCLPLEAFCCAGVAIGGNRQIIKDANGLEDTALERCLGITITVCSLCGVIATYWVSCFDACLYVQQQIEYDKRKISQDGGYRRMEE